MLKNFFKKILPEEQDIGIIHEEKPLMTIIENDKSGKDASVKALSDKIEANSKNTTTSGKVVATEKATEKKEIVPKNPTKEPTFYEIIRKPIYKSLNLAFILVEENFEMNEKSKEIKEIISNMLNNRKDAAFILISYGADIKIYDILTSNSINKESTIGKIVSFVNTCKDVDLLAAIGYVLQFIENVKCNDDLLEVNAEKFKINSFNVITIGTGKSNGILIDKNEIMKIIDILSNKYSVNMKYFCINDVETVEAAKLGFGLIGHINSNFYS